MDGLCFGEVDRRKLQQLWQTTDDASLCRRVQAILAVDEGRSVARVARWHGVSRQTIYAWIERFQSESDPLALQDQKRSGRPRDWTEVTQAALQDCLRWPPGKWGYQAVSWTVLLLQNWLAEYVGRTFSETTIRTHLHAMGYSWKRSRYVLQPDPERDKKKTNSPRNSAFSRGDCGAV